MYGITPQLPRLKSRKSFMNHTKAISSTNPEVERTTRWRNEISSTSSWVPNESLPSGHNETWPVWRTLNRLRAGIGRTKDNLIKWGLLDSTDTLCICGELQTMQHIITCTACFQTCTPEDIHKGTSQGINVARIWAEII
ncbi:unnamed protein product [Macrosiphum euphorbiae]|uniref:Uncharacterized protein n=1 Tax=Macrosiphum euphorbiae TaxID=13131 RepID=A0AAV0Y548_9HEMI|nr:unnamed protein product [Macrosiphum euphorbiae]